MQSLRPPKRQLFVQKNVIRCTDRQDYSTRFCAQLTPLPNSPKSYALQCFSIRQTTQKCAHACSTFNISFWHGDHIDNDIKTTEEFKL